MRYELYKCSVILALMILQGEGKRKPKNDKKKRNDKNKSRVDDAETSSKGAGKGKDAGKGKGARGGKKDSKNRQVICQLYIWIRTSSRKSYSLLMHQQGVLPRILRQGSRRRRWSWSRVLRHRRERRSTPRGRPRNGRITFRIATAISKRLRVQCVVLGTTPWRPSQ